MIKSKLICSRYENTVANVLSACPPTASSVPNRTRGQPTGPAEVHTTPLAGPTRQQHLLASLYSDPVFQPQ